MSTLAELAGAAGLDRDLCSSATLTATWSRRRLAARDIGVSGVPTMILNEKLAVVGAQPVSALRAALHRSEQATA